MSHTLSTLQFVLVTGGTLAAAIIYVLLIKLFKRNKAPHDRRDS